MTKIIKLYITFDEVYRKLDKVLSDCNLNDNEIELLDSFLKKNSTIGKINKLLNDLLKSILKDNKIDMADIPSFILFINEFIAVSIISPQYLEFIK